MINTPNPDLYWILGSIFACLLAGSIVRFVALRNTEETRRRKRLASLGTWWILTLLMSVSLLTGRLGICLLFTFASCIAWFEITGIFGVRKQERLIVQAGYGLIIINYLLILFAAISQFVVFLPLCSLFVFAVLLLINGQPEGYIRSSGSLLWGIMFLGYGLSHAAFLLVVPEAARAPVGVTGWFLFLVILTESNDIFQAIVGRAFGSHKKHRISPVISPNKTWEGFIGGMLITIAIAVIIAPWLTTFGQQPGPFNLSAALQPWVSPVFAAMLIAITGFFGDINMSAIKRDAGIKDSSKLLPGMGGVIDRVDSLTMTAPVFVYFLIWWLA